MSDFQIVGANYRSAIEAQATFNDGDIVLCDPGDGFCNVRFLSMKELSENLVTDGYWDSIFDLDGIPHWGTGQYAFRFHAGIYYEYFDRTDIDHNETYDIIHPPDADGKRYVEVWATFYPSAQYGGNKYSADSSIFIANEIAGTRRALRPVVKQTISLPAAFSSEHNNFHQIEDKVRYAAKENNDSCGYMILYSAGYLVVYRWNSTTDEYDEDFTFQDVNCTEIKGAGIMKEESVWTGVVYPTTLAITYENINDGNQPVMHVWERNSGTGVWTEKEVWDMPCPAKQVYIGLSHFAGTYYDSQTGDRGWPESYSLQWVGIGGYRDTSGQTFRLDTKEFVWSWGGTGTWYPIKGVYNFNSTDQETAGHGWVVFIEWGHWEFYHGWMDIEWGRYALLDKQNEAPGENKVKSTTDGPWYRVGNWNVWTVDYYFLTGSSWPWYDNNDMRIGTNGYDQFMFYDYVDGEGHDYFINWYSTQYGGGPASLMWVLDDRPYHLEYFDFATHYNSWTGRIFNSKPYYYLVNNFDGTLKLFKWEPDPTIYPSGEWTLKYTTFSDATTIVSFSAPDPDAHETFLYLFSWDNVTYYKWSGSAWVVETDASNGMTEAEFNAGATVGFTAPASHREAYVRMYIANDGTKVAEVDRTQIFLEIAIISVSNNAYLLDDSKVRVEHINDTTTRVTNKTGQRCIFHGMFWMLAPPYNVDYEDAS